MARSLRSHRRKKNRVCKLKEVYNPVDQERQERVNRRLLVNTYLNNSSNLEAVKMVIEGEASTDTLKSTKAIKEAGKDKKPFSFIERTWEVRNPTDEEVEEALKAKAAVEEYEREESARRKQELAKKSA